MGNKLKFTFCLLTFFRGMLLIVPCRPLHGPELFDPARQLYSVSQKISPKVFWHFFRNGWEFFRPNFTRLLYVLIYARLQIFI